MLLSVFSCYNYRFCLMPEKSRFLSVKDSIASFLNSGLKTRLQDSEDSLRIFEHDMEIAGKIQRNILPESVPAIAGYDIGAVFKPAKEVGGDFYDFIPLLSATDSMGIVVADVEDKGLPAAMYALLAHGMLYSTLSAYSRATPVKALSFLNMELRHIVREQVSLTMFLGELDPKNHTFKYARAGHERPMAFDSAGHWLLGEARTQGQPLNMFDDPDFDTGSFSFPPGGTVLLFTDGIADETGPDDQMYGHASIARAIVQNPELPAQALCDLVMEDLELHRDGTPQYDDYTLVAIKRKNQ